MSKRTGEYNELDDLAPGESLIIIDGEAHRQSDGFGITLRKTLRSQLKSLLPVQSLSIKAILAESFLATFGFDGYDPAKHEIATHVEDKKNYKVEELSWKLIIASFLGLPSRLPPERDRKLDFKTVVRGFIGGWIPRTQVFDEKIWNKKDQWQRAAIPVKLLLILPLKLVTWPFKLLINIVKLFTEFLPKILEICFGLALLQLISLGIEATIKQQSAKSLVLGILSAITSLFYLGSFLAHLIGRLLTSPEKSARIFYYFIQTRTEKALGENWSIFLGVVFAAMSILYSAMLWAIVLPLAVGFVTANFPIVLQAVAWVMQLPVVGPFLSFVQNVFVAIGSATSSFSNVKFAALFSQSLGLQISNAVLFLCTGIAYLAAPMAVILTHFTDRFSNWWAVNVNVYNTEAMVWEGVGRYQRSFDFRNPGISLNLDDTPVSSVTSQPTQLVEDKNKAYEAALRRAGTVHAVDARTASDPTSGVPPQLPSSTGGFKSDASADSLSLNK